MVGVEAPGGVGDPRLVPRDETGTDVDARACPGIGSEAVGHPTGEEGGGRAEEDGLDDWLEDGGECDRIASVASFYVSRVDSAVDPLVPSALRGKVGIANAKLADGRAAAVTGSFYMLSFDHRGSFERELLGLDGEPGTAERARIRELKTLIYAGFERALTAGAPLEACGVLIDEEFSAEIARAARAAGRTLAMPVERSGRKEFELEFGDDFGRHIEEFDPTYAKVLVRYNPEGDSKLNSRQAERLAKLSRWLNEHGRKLLFELLVPATDEQLEQVGGDRDRYDRERRPALVVRTLAELQDAGVEPRIWKIEGLDTRVDCEAAVAQARRDGRSRVECVVLGRGADGGRVAGWLRVAAPVEGYVGFAIGRTIWEEALRDYLAGRIDAEAASERIADEYRRMIDVYAEAADFG